MKTKTGNCLSRKTTQTETHVTQLQPLFLFGNLNIAVEWATIAVNRVKFRPSVGKIQRLSYFWNGVPIIRYDHGLIEFPYKE